MVALFLAEGSFFMAKKIPLTQGQFSIVDDEDFEWLNQWKWYYNNGYVKRNAKRDNNGIQHKISMHTLLLKVERPFEVDHINRNPLDNRKINLRKSSRFQNSGNIFYKNKTGFKGVVKRINRWEAHIRKKGKLIHLGTYKTSIEAARAYNKAALKYYGEFAYTNIIVDIQS